LGRLFHRDAATKAAVKSIALEALGGRGQFVAYASYFFLFTAKFIGITTATDALCGHGGNRAIEFAIPAVRQMLRFDYPLVPDSCLGRLADLKQLMPPNVYTSTRPFAGDLGLIPRAVDRIKYIRLKTDLNNGANLQINDDKEELNVELSAHGFSPELSNLLEAAETEY